MIFIWFSFLFFERLNDFFIFLFYFFSSFLIAQSQKKIVIIITQPLQNCINPTIRIGQEILCLPYAGFLNTHLPITYYTEQILSGNLFAFIIECVSQYDLYASHGA